MQNSRSEQSPKSAAGISKSFSTTRRKEGTGRDGRHKVCLVASHTASLLP